MLKDLWTWVLSPILPRIVNLAVAIGSFLIRRAGMDVYIAKAVTHYCSLPHEERMEIRAKVAELTGGNNVHIDCLADKED